MLFPGQSSQSVVGGRLPRTASCSRSSLHQHPSRSNRHASGGGAASESLCLRAEAAAMSRNSDDPLASRLSMENSGQIWIQQQDRTEENQGTINIEESVSNVI